MFKSNMVKFRLIRLSIGLLLLFAAVGTYALQIDYFVRCGLGLVGAFMTYGVIMKSDG